MYGVYNSTKRCQAAESEGSRSRSSKLNEVSGTQTLLEVARLRGRRSCTVSPKSARVGTKSRLVKEEEGRLPLERHNVTDDEEDVDERAAHVGHVQHFMIADDAGQ